MLRFRGNWSARPSQSQSHNWPMLARWFIAFIASITSSRQTGYPRRHPILFKLSVAANLLTNASRLISRRLYRTPVRASLSHRQDHLFRTWAPLSFALHEQRSHARLVIFLQFAYRWQSHSHSGFRCLWLRTARSEKSINNSHDKISGDGCLSVSITRLRCDLVQVGWIYISL